MVQHNKAHSLTTDILKKGKHRQRHQGIYDKDLPYVLIDVRVVYVIVICVLDLFLVNEPYKNLLTL